VYNRKRAHRRPKVKRFHFLDCFEESNVEATHLLSLCYMSKCELFFLGSLTSLRNNFWCQENVFLVTKLFNSCRKIFSCIKNFFLNARKISRGKKKFLAERKILFSHCITRTLFLGIKKHFCEWPISSLVTLNPLQIFTKRLCSLFNHCRCMTSKENDWFEKPAATGFKD